MPRRDSTSVGKEVDPLIGVNTSAIHAAGWVSLSTLYLLWPFLGIWRCFTALVTKAAETDNIQELCGAGGEGDAARVETPLIEAAFGGIFMIGFLLLVMSYNHPFSANARIYFATTPIMPDVKGRVAEVPLEPKLPRRRGHVRQASIDRANFNTAAKASACIVYSLVATGPTDLAHVVDGLWCAAQARNAALSQRYIEADVEAQRKVVERI